MGRRLRTRVLVLNKLLVPRALDNGMRDRDKTAKENYKKYFDRWTGAQPLPPLSTGQPVLVKRGKEEQRYGIVQGSASEHRTYAMKAPQETVRRNRRHLQSVLFYRETRDTGGNDLDYHDDRTESENCDIEPQPVSSNNIEPQPVTSNNIEPQPVTSGNIPVCRSRIRKRPVRLIEE